MTGGLGGDAVRPASPAGTRAPHPAGGCAPAGTWSRLQVPGRPHQASGGRGGLICGWLGAFPSGPHAKSARMVRAGGRSRETRGRMRFQGISREPGAPAAPSPWGVLERRS